MTFEWLLHLRRAAAHHCVAVAAVALLVLSCGAPGSTTPPAQTGDAAAQHNGTHAAHDRPVRPARAENDDAVQAIAARLRPQGAVAEAPAVGVVLQTAHEDAAFAELWRKRAEVAFTELRRIFPPRGSQRPEPASVLIFPERGEYEAYAEHFAPENHHALGYYDPMRRELVVAESGSEESLFATLLHETTHLVLRDFLGHRYPPAWLDEGLATYYETGKLIQDEDTGELSIRFGETHREFIRLAARYVAAHGPFDFRRFATMEYESFVDVGASTLRQHYAISYSLVYYLLNGEDGRYRTHLQLYLDEIAAVPDIRMRYVRAFDLCFGPTVYSFEVGWAHWVQRAAHMD